MLPAEWEQQDAIILTWPHSGTDWADSLEDIEPVYADIVAHISQHEDVILICRDIAHKSHIRNYLQSRKIPTQSVRFTVIPTNDTWVRDYGPLTVHNNRQRRLLNFQFDGWGNRYTSNLDNSVNDNLFDQGYLNNARIESIPYVLEGGSIDSDGQGTLLTTESCLLNAGRNPGTGKNEIESDLINWFEAKQILWLKNGYLAGDDTDAHVDNLARFGSPETILYTSCDDPDDEHYESLQAMQVELAQFRQLNGSPYDLIPLPIPHPVYNPNGQRLPASYANFLIINNAVLVPTFDDPNDVMTLRRIADVFPERRIIGIDSQPLIQQHGGIHCMSMQIPSILIP